MPKRLVKKGVTVVRDGKRVRPEVGKLFDFTSEEIASLKEADAAALGKGNEGDTEDGTVTEASTSKGKPSSAEASQAGAKGGKKAATATTENKDSGKAAAKSGGKAGAESDDDL